MSLTPSLLLLAGGLSCTIAVFFSNAYNPKIAVAKACFIIGLVLICAAAALALSDPNFLRTEG